MNNQISQLTELCNIVWANLPGRFTAGQRWEKLKKSQRSKIEEAISTQDALLNNSEQLAEDLKKAGFYYNANNQLVGWFSEKPTVKQVVKNIYYYKKEKPVYKDLHTSLPSWEFEHETGYLYSLHISNCFELLKTAKSLKNVKNSVPSIKRPTCILRGLSSLANELENLESAKRNFAATGKGKKLIDIYQKRVNELKL